MMELDTKHISRHINTLFDENLNICISMIQKAKILFPLLLVDFDCIRVSWRYILRMLYEQSKKTGFAVKILF